MGTHEITVGLKNPVCPIYYDHIKDSPFRVGIEQGADPSKTRVYGPALEEGVQDNLPTHFTIESRDRNDIPLKNGGQPYDVKVKGPKGDVPVEVVDNGDGTYTVNFAPQDAGPHRIDVTLRNKPVANSPYNINVKEGAEAGISFVESYSFVIRARTKSNKNMSKGGEKFEVSIQGQQGKVNNNLKDNGDGTYSVAYQLPQGAKGQFQFSVKVNGKDIQGSPWVHAH